MDEPGERLGGAWGRFRLAEWQVEPSLNRVSRGSEQVQLEPKVMDVLVALASRAGAVVSKDDLIDAVWQRQFISEWVISRAIAKLRSALGDDARMPRFIETISKRGYRLKVMPAPDSQSGEVPAPAVPEVPVCTPRPESARTSSDTPEFCGREAQIGEILEGPRNWIWLLGTRGIGKTTLLRHLERLTLAAPDRGYVPLLWDLQGAGSPATLHQDFGEALRDAAPRLAERAIDVETLVDDDLFVALARLRRRLVAAGATLLLLCDEVEELIQLQEQDPALLRKLRRALQSPQGIRSVLAASPRLWALAAQVEDTSPFLHGFTPPLYLGVLADGEAHALVANRLGSAADRGTVAAVLEASGNHPLLLQTLCERLRARGDLAAALDETVADPGITLLFTVDAETLTGEEREVLLAVGRAGEVRLDELPRELGDAGAVRGVVYRLEHLGMVRQVGGERYRVNGGVLAAWVRAAAG